jgi:hypothetical protein
VERKQVNKEDVLKLLDIIVLSMDFGSGFLETSDVVVLRRVARQVGMDPEDVTPANVPHKYVGGSDYRGYDVCTKCMNSNKHSKLHKELPDDWDPEKEIDESV